MRNEDQLKPVISHNSECEMPLPLYVNLKNHTETRNKGLIYTMYKLGLSISYDCVISISTETVSVVILNKMPHSIPFRASHHPSVLQVDIVALLHLCLENTHSVVAMVQHGMNVDTDVFVLAVSQMQRIPHKEVWLAFGTGKQFRCYPIHNIACSLGPQKSLALPVFHAFTGCDTLPFFASKSKKSAWDTWSVFSEVTKSFLEIANVPSKLSADCKKNIERFEARQQLFALWIGFLQPQQLWSNYFEHNIKVVMSGAIYT